MSDEARPAKRYAVILADPPWSYSLYTGSDKARTADRHYRTMPLEQIKRVPVASLAAPDAMLYLWVPSPQLADGLDVMRTWGFEYVTVGFVWVKLTEDGIPRMGLGHHTRSNIELCLLGRLGSGFTGVRKDIQQLVFARVREHSRKPDEVYQRLWDLYGPERTYLELFSRTPYPGFDTWGNETGKYGAQLNFFAQVDQEVA